MALIILSIASLKVVEAEALFVEGEVAVVFSAVEFWLVVVLLSVDVVLFELFPLQAANIAELRHASIKSRFILFFQKRLKNHAIELYYQRVTF
jgi:hypothetical protein